MRLFYIFATNIAIGTIQTFKLTVYSDVRDYFMGSVSHEHRDYCTCVSSKQFANVIHIILCFDYSFPPPPQYAVAVPHTHACAHVHTQRVNDWKVMYWYEFTDGGVKYFPKLTCLQ